MSQLAPQRNPENQGNPQGAPQQNGNEQVPVVAKKRESTALQPSDFQKSNGIKALYDMISNVDLADADVNIEKTMKKITIGLKTWHFNMRPKYSYEYFLQRCQALGSHKQLQAYMHKVRRYHKNQQPWQILVDKNQRKQLNDNNEPINPNHNQNPNQNVIQQYEQTVQILNSISKTEQQPVSNIQDNDEDYMELFAKMEQVGKKNAKNHVESGDEPEHYVPQGYEPDFDEDDD